MPGIEGRRLTCAAIFSLFAARALAASAKGRSFASI